MAQTKVVNAAIAADITPMPIKAADANVPATINASNAIAISTASSPIAFITFVAPSQSEIATSFETMPAITANTAPKASIPTDALAIPDQGTACIAKQASSIAAISVTIEPTAIAASDNFIVLSISIAGAIKLKATPNTAIVAPNLSNSLLISGNLLFSVVKATPNKVNVPRIPTKVVTAFAKPDQDIEPMIFA